MIETRQKKATSAGKPELFGNSAGKPELFGKFVMEVDTMTEQAGDSLYQAVMGKKLLAAHAAAPFLMFLVLVKVGGEFIQSGVMIQTRQQKSEHAEAIEGSRSWLESQRGYKELEIPSGVSRVAHAARGRGHAERSRRVKTAGTEEVLVLGPDVALGEEGGKYLQE